MLVDRALADPERGLGRAQLALAPDARTFLARRTRRATRASRSARSSWPAHLARARGTQTLDLPLLEEAAQQRALRYDKGGRGALQRRLRVHQEHARRRSRRRASTG